MDCRKTEKNVYIYRPRFVYVIVFVSYQLQFKYLVTKFFSAFSLADRLSAHNFSKINNFSQLNTQLKNSLFICFRDSSEYSGNHRDKLIKAQGDASLVAKK